MPKITLKSVVCFFRNLRSYISGWRNMVYTDSNTGNVNSFGTNQVFKHCRLVIFSTLSLLGLTAINSVQAANECDSFLSCCDTGKNCRQFYLGGIVGAGCPPLFFGLFLIRFFSVDGAGRFFVILLFVVVDLLNLRGIDLLRLGLLPRLRLRLLVLRNIFSRQL